MKNALVHHEPRKPVSRISRRDFLKLSGAAGAAWMLGGPQLAAQTNPTGPGAVRFAVIGDFGETLADETFPLDHVAAMVRSWNPDFVVSVGDNNYVLGEAATIDVNIGKNFTGYIYPKTTEIPVQYPYPPGAPAFNRFIPCLGNHDYSDVADDMLPSVANVAKSQPYIQYFQDALRTGLGLAPHTTVQFADNAVGHTWTQAFLSGNVEDYAPFSEAENLRFFDVRLGTATGPSSVHLFVFDSNPATPYGRYAEDRVIPNRNGSPSAFTEYAVQARWLQQRLAASTAQWKIVIFHHPPYNSAPGAENLQYPFLRWPFQAWGATAVITGHVHNYERLEMPDADSNNQPVYGQPTIPYMVNGAGGFIPEQGFDPSFVITGSKVRVAEYGAQLITADENSINFLYFDLNGVLRDVRTIYANPQTGAPQVEFGGREFPVDASAGTVLVPVTRLGDASAALTVDYATMDGTALAGVNYQAASGTLQFAPNEREKTIAITIFPPPIFGSDTVPWESLVFSVGLSSPTTGTVGFFNVGTVIMVNTVDTPITNQDLFIVQTYRDLFQIEPTAQQIQSARSAIGVLDLWIERAKWVYDLLMSNYPNEDVFQGTLCYSALILADVAVLEGQAVPPSYPDLVDAVTLIRGAATPDDALTALSEAFNDNILSVLNSKVPGFETDNTLFIKTIYLVLISSEASDFSSTRLGAAANSQDLAYWLSQLSNASPTERARTRNLMLGRIASQSFNPPPVAGMTPFDLTTENRNEVLLGMAIAGLARIQLTYAEFAKGYLIPARLGEIVFIDLLASLLQSPAYAARFRVTSYEGFIDSVRGNLSLADRAPDADPDGNGFTNFEEYSFALAGGSGRVEPLTEIQVESAGGQTFALFSYRQAANVRRVEFLVQTSPDLVTWTAAGTAIPAGGTDFGTHVVRRVRIPVPTTPNRLFVRVRVRETP
ncbi:MAG: Calx-beta domain-containing protein [Terrimicrobiaceae bacterium]|nr:Calx-beta domain-containing protein [Terrimicrobiaceae bacterium]